MTGQMPQFIETEDVSGVPEVEGQLIFTIDGNIYWDSPWGRKLIGVQIPIYLEITIPTPSQAPTQWSGNNYTHGINNLDATRRVETGMPEVTTPMNRENVGNAEPILIAKTDHSLTFNVSQPITSPITIAVKYWEKP